MADDTVAGEDPCGYYPGMGDVRRDPKASGVFSYAGYRGEETPRRLRFGGREVAVTAILERWLAPDHRGFRVRGDDGAVYVLRQDLTSLVWEVVISEA